MEIPTNYILSLEDNIPKEDHIQRIHISIFRGNSLIGSSSQNDTRRRFFQKLIREKVHSPFLILGYYYNGEREIEDTKILIDSFNHI